MPRAVLRHMAAPTRGLLRALALGGPHRSPILFLGAHSLPPWPGGYPQCLPPPPPPGLTQDCRFLGVSGCLPAHPAPRPSCLLQDHGNFFTYTGSGGRDLSGNKRTAEQSCDQKLTNTNRCVPGGLLGLYLGYF